jgi:hypothetical protein
MHPFRPFVQKYNGYVINTYIRKELDKRYQETKSEGYLGASMKSKPTKSVITLALEAYLAQNQSKNTL